MPHTTKKSMFLSRRTVMAGVAAAAWTSRARATDVLPASDAARQLVDEGLYLPLWHFWQEQAASNANARWMAAQIAAMAGDEAAAFNVPVAVPHAVPGLDGCRAVDALDAIAWAAKDRRIVILNEAHHVSRCRAFAGLVAARLQSEGFTVFAAETFGNTATPPFAADQLNGDAPVTPALGWYLADPVYAETIRAARRLGYRFAAYEARRDQMAAATAANRIEVREDAEANNFIANILDKDTKSRVLVLCGYDHLRKAQLPGGQMWFAARLKAKTGLDPLTISQSWSAPPPDRGREDPVLKTILDSFQPVAPVVLFGKNGKPLCLSAPDTGIDLEVVHSRLEPVDSRPGWLAALPERKRAPFALAALTAPGDLIQAVPLSEAAAPNVVPSDQFPLTLGAREAVFFLTPGEYEIRLETIDGRDTIGHLKV